jgi:hypothetical protein
MVPGLIMWLLGVPLVVIVLLFIFHGCRSHIESTFFTEACLRR